MSLGSAASFLWVKRKSARTEQEKGGNRWVHLLSKSFFLFAPLRWVMEVFLSVPLNSSWNIHAVFENLWLKLYLLNYP